MHLNQLSNSSSYRWVILCVSFLLMVIVNGMTFGGPTVFDDIFLNTLKTASGESITRGELKFRETIMIWSAAGFGFLSGIYADRHGVKTIIILGLSLMTIIYYLFSGVENINQIYWVYLGFGPCLIFVGSLVNVILISKWFTKNRGLGLGIMASGSSIGSAILSPIYAWMLGFMEWREILLWNSMIPLVMILIVVLLIKEQPTNQNHQKTISENNDEKLQGVLFAEAVRTKNLWLIILMAMCIFYSMMGMTTNAFLFLKDSGFNTQVASISATLIFLGSLAGKVSCGFFAENLGRKKVLLVYFSLLIIGAVLLTLATTNKEPLFIWFGLGIFGLGFGGIYTLKQLLSADLFGLKSLGKITGLINFTDTIGAGLGPVLTGIFFDQTGSYQYSFIIITAITIIGMTFASFITINDREIEFSKRQLTQS